MTGNCESCKKAAACKSTVGIIFGCCRSEYEPTDERLEELWAEFEDVPMDQETECMEAPFLHFQTGTHREEIWRWFDKRYSGGVFNLLYPSCNSARRV